MTECGQPGWRKALSGPGLCWVPEFASPGLLCVYGGGGLTLLEGCTWNLLKWSSLLKAGLTSSRTQSSALTAVQEGGQWEQHLHPVQCPAGAWLRSQLLDSGVLWPPGVLVNTVMLLIVPPFQTCTGVCTKGRGSRVDQRCLGQLSHLENLFGHIVEGVKKCCILISCERERFNDLLRFQWPWMRPIVRPQLTHGQELEPCSETCHHEHRLPGPRMIKSRIRWEEPRYHVTLIC